MKSKRIMSFLLSMAMTVSMLSSFTITALAEETQTTTTEKNITLGTTALKGGQKSNVYFGNYQQSKYTPTTAPVSPADDMVYTDSDGTKFVYLSKANKYYKIEPIKWRVLSNADGKAFLLSDKNLDMMPYSTPQTDVTWGTSTIRSWLNGYGAESNQNSVDYSSDNFINAAFGAAEKGVIAETTVVNENNPTYGTNGGNNTTDKVFLLSIAEAQNTAYGFTNTDTRKALSSTYVYDGGKSATSSINNTSWWLRSPGNYTSDAAFVDLTAAWITTATMCASISTPFVPFLI